MTTPPAEVLRARAILLTAEDAAHDAHSAAAEAMGAAEASLGLAKCLDTIVDRLASDDPAIRVAALQALGDTP